MMVLQDSTRQLYKTWEVYLIIAKYLFVPEFCIASLMIIRIKRVYDDPKEDNSFRILVDRLWPRGLSKEKTRIDLWQKDIAPSNTLRKWFGHDEKKWDEFKRKYFKELDTKSNSQMVDEIIKMGKEHSSITLLYGTKEERFNNAVALKEYLEDYI
jgi:uncharacterized protein YeaO (DUF488 family)